MLPEQQLILLDLYDEEIIKRIAVNHAETVKFAPLLARNEYRTIIEQYDFSWTAFATKLWERLWEAPTRDDLLYTTVLTFLFTCDKKLHRQLTCVDGTSSLLDFMAVLTNLKKFFEIMKPDVICEKISAVSEHHAKLMEPVKGITERLGEVSAKKYILRMVPEMGEGAYLDLLNAIAACSDEGRNFVTNTYPNFERYYRKLYFCRPEMPLADIIMESKSNKSKKEHIVDLRYQHFPPNESDMPEEDIYEGEVIVLRAYQQELAKPAYDGHNTLICAPTGTGKTIVAASIARHHLFMGRKKKQHTKVCFFVTNTTFLEQQAKTLEKFVGHRWKVVSLCGVTVNTPVAETIEAYDVIVITPQLVVNLLKMPDSSLQFSLSSFSLMFFDEAHHTDSNHPYNVIMNDYHYMKHTGKIEDGKCLPQIVGLTASLGIGNAQTETEAVEHFIKMCANLDIAELSYVRENIDEMGLFCSIAVDETKLVVSDLAMDPVAIAITDLMKQFERILDSITNSIKMPFHSVRFNDMLFKLQRPPGDKSSKVYETWFSQLLVRLVPEAKLEKEERVRIMMCLQLIEILYRTLEQYVHFPSHVAKQYFEDECKVLRSTIGQEYWDIMQACPLKNIVGNTSNNELYNELVRILRSEFTNRKEGRAIVFVKVRDFAGRLCQQLNDDEHLKNLGIKSDIITGVNAAGDAGGQSISEQRDTLARFSDGNIKILCATSVAEEGIDIQKCNLVIKYNYVSNEIAHIQRRGRGRAANSRCILLTCDPKLQAREEKNIICEKLMRNALQLISRMPPNWFREEVAKCVKRNMEEQARKKLLADLKKDALLSRIYMLLCKKCDAVICSSNDIVVTCSGTQYLCACKEIWDRSRQFPYPKGMIEKGERFLLKGVGALSCANCGHQWGRVVQCNGITLPVIAAEAFVLVAENGERFSRRRWKQIVESFFKPRDIELYDYATMKSALSALTDTASLFDISN